MNKSSDSPVASSPDPAKPTLWNRLSTNALVKFLLFFASGWALIEIFRYFEYVIFVFTFAAILALLLNYPARYLERFLGRGIALGIVITVSLVLILTLAIIAGIIVATQFSQIVDTVTQILGSSTNPLDQFNEWLLDRNIRIDLEPIEAQIQNLVSSSLNVFISSVTSLFSNYVTFILILVISFFLLIDGERIWHFILRLVSSRYRERFTVAIQCSFIGFLRGQLVISFLLSLAMYLSFSIFQIPSAFALAAIVGAFDLIPGIGATLGVSVACLIVLVQSGWIAALKVVVVSVTLQQIQDNFVAPRVMQSTVHLSPVVVFFALLVGARIAGLLGVFLAVPVAGAIVSLLELEELQAK